MTSHNDDVCWHDFRCFKDASWKFKRGNKEISVCDLHFNIYKSRPDFTEI